MIDVLIVGAGPAGLTLACDLARQGVDFRLIEKLIAPATASKGKGLQPRTLEVFDDLGVVDEVLAAGCLYPPMRFYKDGVVVIERMMMERGPVTESVPYPNVIMLPQWKTEAILRKRLLELGGTVEQGVELVSIEQGADNAVAQLADGTSIVTRYIVGTDGGRSTVRRLSGIALLGGSTNLPGLLVADITVENLDRNFWHFWGSSQADMLGLCPLPSTDGFQLTRTVPMGETPSLDRLTLQTLIDTKSERSDLLIGEPSWTSVYRPNLLVAERFRDKQVFLVGDAAHIHPPAGGQGLNTSVQDAYNLGWKLRAVLGGADQSLLDTYEEERLPIAAAVLGHSELLYRKGFSSDALASRRGDDEKQLLLNYRGSSLAQSIATTEGLAAGDRMPDGQLVLSDGQITTVFAQLRGPEWVVLDFGGAFQANNVKVIPVRGSGPAVLVAVRPDGYVGMMGGAEDVSHFLRQFM